MDFVQIYTGFDSNSKLWRLNIMTYPNVPATSRFRLKKLIPFALTMYALATSNASAQPTTKPDALLAIDMNRSAVVEKISSTWAKEISPAQSESFNAKLNTLRADQLLAASMSGSFDAVLEIMVASADSLKASPARAIPAAQNSPLSSNISENNASDQSKAVGEVNQDLLYTPIAPCRVFDTRTPGAPFISNGLTSGVVRSFDMDGANLSAQGGATAGCNIPTAARAVVLAFSPITPPTTGWFVGAANDGSPMPASTLFNYSSALTLTTFTVVMPMLGQAGGDIRLEARGVSAYSVHGVGDVTGYFMPPSRNGDGLRVIWGGTGNAVSVVNGESNNNTGTAVGSTISGGFSNTAAVNNATIGGGAGNTASGVVSTIAGGENNTSLGVLSTIAGGSNNTSSGERSTISGGGSNTASGPGSAIAGGFQNRASGQDSFVGGGINNTASARQSSAFGHNANANKENCANFALWQATTIAVPCFVDSGVQISGVNGLIVYYDQQDPSGVSDRWVGIGWSPVLQIQTSSTANLTNGGVWTNASDRAKKENFARTNPASVLQKVLTLPVTTWNYIKEGKDIKRMGPMAQDFRSAFGLGSDDKTIGTVDATGVAFAAIQGLNQKLVAETKAKDAKISAQAEKLSSQESKLSSVERELAVIKKKLGL
jgi:hypothetical protein